MTDTTTQAALSRMIERVTSDPDGPYASALIASCEPMTIVKLCQAIASLTAERDELRAQLRWHDVRTDGPPPCDGEAVFDGINSAGYPAAFNAYRATDGDCYMETAESNVHVMGDLRYWRRHVGPATEGEANV